MPVTKLQGCPDPQPEFPEIPADLIGVSITPIQVSPFGEPIPGYTLQRRTLRRNPGREHIRGLVVQVSSESLELGREAGAPAPR